MQIVNANLCMQQLQNGDIGKSNLSLLHRICCYTGLCSARAPPPNTAVMASGVPHALPLCRARGGGSGKGRAQARHSASKPPPPPLAHTGQSRDCAVGAPAPAAPRVCAEQEVCAAL